MKLLNMVSILVALGLASACQTSDSKRTSSSQTQTIATVPDQPLTGDELAERIVGKTLTYYDNSKSQVRTDGTYEYTDAAGNKYPSTYTITQNGAVCLKLRSDRSRCDTYVLSGEKLVFINSSGGRYEVINIEPNS